MTLRQKGSQPKGKGRRELSAEQSSRGSLAASARLADALVVRRVQAGELHAFSELVVKYQQRIFNACLRICGQHEDAADLTQDAFLKALGAIAEFRGASAFYTWIFRIAINLAMSHQRKRRTRVTISLDGDAGENGAGAGRQLAGDAPEPASRMEADELSEQVAAALAALDPEYRVAVVLRDVEGCDYQEIADILEVPVGTVKSRIFRGRMALRGHLEPAGPRRAKAK
jgi:RNA polymerase sigma-70 factor (ECF subfamily)